MSGRSAERVLELLEWFAWQTRPRSLTEIVEALQFPKSSVLMLLRMLVAKDYLARNEAGLYEIVHLPGEGYSGGLAWGAILRIALPHVQRAVAESNESGFTAVLDHDMKIRYLNKLLPNREIKYDRDVSVSRLACQVASGHVLLAGLNEGELADYWKVTESAYNDIIEREEFFETIKKVRAQGYSVNLKGRVEGAAGIAAPIVDGYGRSIAAINIAGPKERIASQLDALISIVTETASNISEAVSDKHRINGN